MARHDRSEPDRGVLLHQGSGSCNESEQVRADHQRVIQGGPKRQHARRGHYTASKAGLLGLTRAAAKELGRYGITVNAVCPGVMDTELTHQTTTVRLESISSGFPIPRLGTPTEFADLVCFLASDGAGYITGASIDINGGALMI
jgi:3-oxoacyl-[acyl-carrier protein] reductase